MKGILHSFAIIALLIFGLAPVAHAQVDKYPNRSVQILTGDPAGSSPDVVTRLIAFGLGKIWRRKVIVINHPGANGSIAAHYAAGAAPDGYTLFAPGIAPFIALPNVVPDLPLKLPSQFLPIAYIAEQPMFIAVSPLLGVKTIPQFIALAKKEPGRVSIATTGLNHISYLTGSLLIARTNAKLLLVPYTHGPAASVSDVASGRTSAIISAYPGLAGAVNAKEVRLIAVASPKRLPDHPNLPTVAESIPGFVASGWVLLVAPLGTPAAIIKKVNADFNKVISEPKLKARLATLGNYTRTMTPKDVIALVAREQKTWFPLLKSTSKK